MGHGKTVLLLIAFLFAPAGGALAQDSGSASPSSAPVVLDGRTLFTVRGVSAFPAEERADRILDRIKALARDPAFRAESLQVAEAGTVTDILVRGERLMSVFDVDAEGEGVGRHELALAVVARLGPAIETYREARRPERLWQGAILALAATVVMLVVLRLLLWGFGRVHRWTEGRYRQRIRGVGIQAFSILKAEHLWTGFQGVVTLVRMLALALVGYAYLNFVLGRFPWTRPVADQLLDFLMNPLRTMGAGLLDWLPSFFFLVILFLILRWVLKLLRLFFDAVGQGRVLLSGFEAEWAEPTHRIVRLLVVVFAVVVAFPYIPGSSSGAFKGVSLFLGLMFSLGSSSVLSNLIAGYSMTYRRTFRVGDRVKINDVVGDVTSTRLQETHLRTPKNEEVIIPNSMILNGQVVNYSFYARQGGIILHTTVGIGYETPWRQVEAMLKLAAGRTPELLADPAPFVNIVTLGDFCVTYELNAYCGDARIIPLVYTAMHRNILDVFNEFGVQIMTPAYEGDPEQPKVVPRERWHESPASPESGA